METITCSICGEKINPRPGDPPLPMEAFQLYHLATRHPWEALRHPQVGPRIASAAYSAGQQLSEILKGAFK